MQSLTVASKDAKIREEYVLKVCNDLSIDILDTNIVDEQDELIGIAQVRALQKSLFLKPFKSKIKAAIVKNSQNLTIAAQNALLKVLEEPPDNTLIILTVSKKDLLLPTILSRCKIIELGKNAVDVSEQEILEYTNILVYLQSANTTQKLKLAQDFGKDKDGALHWLEKMILVARQKLIDDILENKNHHLISQYLNILISFQRTLIILKTTNVNPRFALENLFLSIS